MSGPSTVTLEGVAKRYGRRGPWVLRNINLALPQGSLTVLSGVNGSGKTTMLRIIAGLSRPTLGTARSVRRVAVVPDRLSPPARMTGRSYLCHQGRLRGLATAEANGRAEEMSERLGVRPGLDVPLQDLSKGNLQKVALAQAFLASVELLALDEPRTAIDPPAAAALDELLDGARRRGTAVVVSDPTSAAAYGGARRYELAGGHLQVLGAVEPPSAGRVTIRLRAPGAGVPAPGRFLALAQAWSGAGEGMITLVVDPGCSDELLRGALDEGWSVLGVQRDSGSGQVPSAGSVGAESSGPRS